MNKRPRITNASWIVAVGLALAMSVANAAEQNPPPAMKFEGFGTYQLADLEVGDAIMKKKNADKVVARVKVHFAEHVQPVVDDWNTKPGDSTAILRIEPRIVGLHKPSGANRFFAGAMAGQSHILIQLRITDTDTNTVIAEPEFYQHANALGAAWSIGATDNAMLERVTELIAGYLKRNYLSPEGGPTGYGT
jgi:hypothetical protein